MENAVFRSAYGYYKFTLSNFKFYGVINIFTLKFLILNSTKEELSNINDIEEFEREFGTVEGQIQLNFNDIEEGVIDEELIFISELIISWFKRLNQVLLSIKSNKYVAMNIPESDNIWYEFRNEGKYLIVSKVKSIKTNNICDFVVIKPIKKDISFWKGIKIKKTIFKNEILKATQNLIDEIILINDKLKETLEVKELTDLYNNLK
ncbi:TPA: hypothetical protein PTV44_000030 [Clostridium botulinum]|nr:hypothetical protein [Clostridium botulinum]